LPGDDTYDVFVSYSRADEREAKAIDAALCARGLKPFFDRRNLPLGLPWIRELERAINTSRSAIVLIGPSGLGNTQQHERQLAFVRQTSDPTFPVVPVILPGAASDRPLDFLNNETWVDFSRVATVSDAPDELERLLSAIKRRQTTAKAGPPNAISPYRGLDAFREEDSAFFFGRGRADDPKSPIGELVDKVRDHPFVMVVGRSGSGKSSLVYAGLLPALRRQSDRFWHVLSFPPGPEPLRALAIAFNPHADGEGAAGYADKISGEADKLRTGDPDLLSHMVRDELERAEGKPDHLLIYIDQWEELYAQAPSSSVDKKRSARHAADVNRFIDLLLTASGSAPVTVVATVRADFYDPLIGHPAIRALLPTQQVLLGSMTRSELKLTIEEPAKRVGVAFAPPTLVGQILDDAGEDEGMLPLLQYALDETWSCREGNLMTANSYARSGGVRQAIRITAEDTFKALSEGRQEAARKLFLSLVTPGEGQEDTRARAAMPTEGTLREIVDQFAGPRKRLLVTGFDRAGRPTVEVAHEALIRTWPRLRQWIDDNREKLRSRAAIVQAKAEWEQQGRIEDLLLPKGFQLERARDFLDHPGDLKTDDIREYFELSSAKADAERKEEDAKREAADAERRRADAERERADAERKKADAERREALERERGHVAKTRLLQRRIGRGLAMFGVFVIVALGGALWKSFQTLEREAAVFGGAGLSAFEQGFCDRALRLVVGGLPPLEGASPISIRSRELEGDLSLYASARNCYIRLALPGHRDRIFAAAFSPDGNRIVTASADKTARLWDSARGTSIAELSGHTGLVNTAAFSPDGNRIVTASADKTARLWDATTGAPIHALSGHGEAVNSAAFSADGRRVVTASLDSYALVWDATTGDRIATLSGHTGPVNGAVFSPDGSRIVTASADKTARLWDTTTGALLATLSGHTGPVNRAVFSPDGNRIVTASADKTAHLWDGTTGDGIAPLSGHTGSVNAAVFSPDGSHIVTASDDNSARVWDPAAATAIILSGHAGPVYSAAFSRDGGRIVTASADNTARIWDATTDATLATLSGHTDAVFSAAFSPDERRIVTASADTVARIWDAATDPGISLSGHAQKVFSAVFSRDGSRIVTASADDTAYLWDATTGARTAPLSGHTGPVNGAAFSQDGHRIVTASDDKTARIWNGVTGAPIATLSGHDDRVSSAAFSPDGSRIVTASADNTARIWNAATGVGIHTLGHGGKVYSAVFSRDGRRIVTASLDSYARVWDSTTGDLLATLSGHTGPVNGAVFSPDGSRIVTASVDKTARLWDSTTGDLLATLSGHRGPVNEAVFSPGGSLIVTASDDNTVGLWKATTGAPIATLLGHSGKVYGAEFSQDGRHIVSASDDNSARVWDAATNAAVARLSGHRGPVYSAAFSPDGSRIATASDDTTARIWPLDPIVRMPSDQRQRYVCQERLTGLKFFAEREMRNPILRDHDDLRDPCARVGPLDVDYYQGAISELYRLILR
jgi:WD40 repeat protein